MAQTQYQFRQGQDQVIRIEVTDNGQVQDFTSADNVKVQLFVSGKSEDATLTYCLNPDSGEKPLTVDATTKELEIILEGADSRQFPTGILLANVKAWIPNVKFTDGNEEKEYGTLQIGTVTKGNMKDVDI